MTYWWLSFYLCAYCPPKIDQPIEEKGLVRVVYIRYIILIQFCRKKLVEADHLIEKWIEA